MSLAALLAFRHSSEQRVQQGGKHVSRVALVAFAVVAAGCGGDERAADSRPTRGDGRLTVAAVNYPLAFFAGRIGGDLVRVEYPLPAGVDPAFWQPSPDDIARIQAADVILLNGAGYAKWVPTATLPSSRVVETADSARDRFITIEGAVTHTHGPEGDHSHGETAFTTWLDPQIAIVQARATGLALSAARPGDGDTFDANLRQVVGDIESLDEELHATFGRFADRRVVASHPVYQYLASRYGLDLVSVHFEPDEPPTEAQWRELEALLEDHPASVMLWEAEPLPQTRERMEALGVKVVVFAPAASRPDSGDYLSVMRDNVTNLEQALLAVESP